MLSKIYGLSSHSSKIRILTTFVELLPKGARILLGSAPQESAGIDRLVVYEVKEHIVLFITIEILSEIYRLSIPSQTR